MDRGRLRAQLIIDEGKQHFAYQDSLGYWTLGVGRNVDRRGGLGLSDEEILYLLDHDIDRVQEELDKNLPWWCKMTEARQNVLMNMAFNMGIASLLGFHNTLAAMERGEYEAAAQGMEDSKWFRQVGARAVRLAAMMRSGQF